ncbi:hypothetical protein [Arenibacter algicola]
MHRINTSLIPIIFILFCTSCAKKIKEKVKNPMDNPSGYYEIQGRVYKTRDYWDWKYFETSRDILYEYHLEKSPPLKGEITHTTLFGLYEGDLISVIVSKEDQTEYYYNGPGILLDTILEFDRFE